MLPDTITAPGRGNISLVLRYAPLGLVSANHAEFGRNSMLVDTGCINLSNNSEVDVVLSIRNGNQHSVHRIRARVAGSAARGVRLEFEECDGTTLAALLPYITLH